MDVPPHPTARAGVGVFGGSGLYRFLTDTEALEITTPFGPPSAPVTLGEVDGQPVAFMPRHGDGHTVPPHRINFRANVWAMKHLGVTDMVLPCAVGSLRSDLAPGTFVLADQVVDRTRGRLDTFHDGPEVVHVSFADPYDEEMRATALEQAGRLDIPVRADGTLVVIQGPRFSTRAESRWFSRQGWHVVGMTQYPEVALCREAEMAALNISLVTDFDAGVRGEEDAGVAGDVAAVTSRAVLEVFNANIDNLRRLLFAIIPALPRTPDRPALHALRDAQL